MPGGVIAGNNWHLLSSYMYQALSEALICTKLIPQQSWEAGSSTILISEVKNQKQPLDFGQQS